MQLKFGLTLTVLLALAAKGHSQLQCYVCDNCAKIDKTTPLQTCGGDAVATTTATTSSVTMSTTEMPTSESTTQSTTTTTTTEDPTTHSTKIPTPPTVGPIASTTGLPTPPSVGTVEPSDFELSLNNTPLANSTNLNIGSQTPTLFVTPEEIGTTLPSLSVESNGTTPSPFLVRSRRYIPENGVTYHCFKVQKKYDNVYGTQRGCMGVQTQQSVCGELKTANSNQIQQCRPCSTNKCNGSATIGVSIAAMLVALVAVMFRV